MAQYSKQDSRGYGSGQVIARPPKRRLSRRQKRLLVRFYLVNGYSARVIAGRIFPPRTPDAAQRVLDFIAREGLTTPAPVDGKCAVTGAPMSWLWELVTFLQNHYPQVLLPCRGQGMLVGGRRLSLEEAVKLANHRMRVARADGYLLRHNLRSDFVLPSALKREAFKIPKGRTP